MKNLAASWNPTHGQEVYWGRLVCSDLSTAWLNMFEGNKDVERRLINFCIYILGINFIPPIIYLFVPMAKGT